MSTTTLPNIRVSSDLTVRVRLKDGGVAIDWSTLNNIKAHIYSDAQRALAGRCDVSVDAEDSTLLVCSYAANKPQYVGVNRIVVSAKYMGETKTYDKPAFNFVRWTADQEGEEITIDDPDVDVEIEVEDVTSSILQEAIDAALQAAADAEHAAHLVPLEVLQDCEQATADAIEAAATANAAGIDEVQATVDAQVGTPSVDVDLENKVLSLDFHNMKGETGEAAGFGTASASLTEDGGDPSVTVSASGPDTAKQFAFTFKNLKGDKGDKGDQGNTGSSVEYPYELVNNLTTNDATKGLTAAMGVTLEGEVSQLEAKVTDLEDDASSLLEEVFDVEDIILPGTDTGNLVINSSGAVVSTPGANYHVVDYDVSQLQGKTVFITASTNWGNCLYAIYDDNNTLLEMGGVAPSSGTEFEIIDEEVILPNNASSIKVAYNVSFVYANVKVEGRTSRIDELEQKIDIIPTEDAYIDKVENTISGKVISAQGVITDTGATYTISNNVNVRVGETIYITASSNWGNALYAFYASDNSLVQVGTLAASSGNVTEIEDAEVIVPNNAAYVVAARNTNSLKPISVKVKDGVQIKKRFSGKKWVVVGDSLTEENSATTKHYFDYIAEETGISTVNMGVGGTGYMRGKNTSQAFYQRISSIDQNADVVTIFGSFNDLNYPALGFNSMEEAIGNYDDDTDATISGCINLTIENLQAAIPLVRLGIVAPCPWASTRPFQSDALLYVDRLKKIAEYHSIPFLDLWRGSNLRPWDADFRALAYTKDLGQDNNPVGTHPDETGHAILAPKFEAFLGELLL